MTDANMQLTDEQIAAIESGIAAMKQCGWTHRVPELMALLSASKAAAPTKPYGWVGAGNYWTADELTAKQVGIRTETPMVPVYAEPVEQLEDPIYQLRLANGSWQDINERAYQYNLAHCPEDSRIVYTCPQPSPTAVVLDDERAAESLNAIAKSVFGGINALRWLLNITTEFDRKDVRTRQAARLLDEFCTGEGTSNRVHLEHLWKTLNDTLSLEDTLECLRAPDRAVAQPVEQTRALTDGDGK